MLEQSLFRSHRSNTFGHSDTEINHTVDGQFESTASGNNFTRIKWHLRDFAFGRANAVREAMAKRGAVGLKVHLGTCHDDSIDQNSGDLNLASG